MEDEDDEEPAPLFCRRTSTPTSSFSSRGSQWRRSTLSSLDSAIDVDDQQSDHEAQDVPRPGRKRPKRGPTATVTTVEPVASTAAEEKDTGKRDKKKHKKRHRQLAGRSGQGSGSTLQQVKELRSDAMKYHWPLFAYCRHNNKDSNYCSLCCK